MRILLNNIYDNMTYNDTLHNDIMTFTNSKQIYTY